jgi:hypothetical protein
MAYLRNGTKPASRSCILKGKLCSGKKPHLQCVLVLDTALS